MAVGCPIPMGWHSTQVQVDHEVSDAYTVIDTFAYGKARVLFVIAKTLAQSDLSTHMARIGTRLDLVGEMFHVITTSGERIQEAIHCDQIQGAIQKAVNAFLDEEL